MVNKLTRTAHVHEGILLDGKNERRPGEREWDSALRAIKDEYPLKDRLIDGLYYDPIYAGSAYVLGVHKPLDANFMSRVDSDASSISDVIEADSQENLMHSSAVLFTGVHHVFAIARGSQSAPGPKSLKPFLSRFFPSEDPGLHWGTRPYMDKAKIQQLRRARGVVSYTSKFRTHRDLFLEEDQNFGPAGFADQVADFIGQDVNITIEVSLPRESQGKSATRKLHQFALSGLKRTAGIGAQSRARVLFEDGLSEELSLVAHRMTAEFEIPDLDNERKEFTHLATGLNTLKGKLEKQVRVIEEG